MFSHCLSSYTKCDLKLVFYLETQSLVCICEFYTLLWLFKHEMREWVVYEKLFCSQKWNVFFISSVCVCVYVYRLAWALWLSTNLIPLYKHIYTSLFFSMAFVHFLRLLYCLRHLTKFHFTLIQNILYPHIHTHTQANTHKWICCAHEKDFPTVSVYIL